jgi:hypothetical protein
MTTYRLELADAAGTRGSVTLTVPDAETGGARAGYEAVLSGPALGEGVIVVRDDDVAPPKGRLLEVRADGLWAELVCETPGEHWGFGLEAFGLRHESEADAATSVVGERLPVGLDLEWEAPRTVRGELLVGRARIPFDGTGTFTVS